MSNYRGFFNSLECKKYRVDIITNQYDTNFTEIPLAADQPFVVTYNDSDTPFDPIRTSTAVINIVYDEYLADALTSCAQGTIVELRDITNSTTGTIKWIGYLVPRVYNASYVNCNETFSLEAADCLSSLQYVDYEYVNDGGLANLLDIIAQCVNKMELVTRFYWVTSKRDTSISPPNNLILPEHLMISEHNFTTNDTDEKWKCQAILSEICRYLGFTCLQVGTYLYFLDYQYLEANERMYAYYYNKYNNYTRSSYTTDLGASSTISQSCIRGNNHDISFVGIYNHIMVKDNLYAAEEFIPAIFEDDYLTNRNGDFYSGMKIEPLKKSPNLPDRVNQPDYVAMYPNGTHVIYGQDYDKEWEEHNKTPLQDDFYTYYHRLYDNKYWESKYYNTGGTEVSLSTAATASSAITRNYAGGTIVDMGVVRNAHMEGQQSSTLSIQQWIVPSQMDYTRYLCICTKYNNNNTQMMNKVAYKLKDGWKPNVMLGDDSYLVLDFTALWERYIDRNYINPKWCNTECKHPLVVVGSYYNKMQKPRFKLHIGDKGWSTQLEQWIDLDGSVNQSRYDWVEPDIKWDAEFFNYWNEEAKCLNNISWEDKLNVSGYKIPISGTDITEGVEFEIYFPKPIYYGNNGSENKYYDWNAYYWIKDFSLKCVQANQPEDGNEADLLYENEPDSNCSINDLEMTLKITTNKEGVKPSYSHMIYKRDSNTKATFLTGVTETAISGVQQKPEENIIEKYVNQYSTPTRKISLELDMEHTPFQKTYNVDVENPNNGYVQLGCEIDYRMDKQRITFIEKDK